MYTFPTTQKIGGILSRDGWRGGGADATAYYLNNVILTNQYNTETVTNVKIPRTAVLLISE